VVGLTSIFDRGRGKLSSIVVVTCRDAGDQAKRRIEHLEDSIARAQARETQIVEMSQWMSDVCDLLQTRLDADVLASDAPKEFEVIVLPLISSLAAVVPDAILTCAQKLT